MIKNNLEKFYIQQKHFQVWKLETSNIIVISSYGFKQIVINNDTLENLFFDLFDEVKKNKINYITIYVDDLGKLKKLIIDISIINVKTFLYINNFYSIKIENKLIKKNKLIFKDIHHFFSYKNDTSINEIYTNLDIVAKYLYIKYKVNIHDKFRLSISSLACKIYETNYKIKAKLVRNLNKKQDQYIRKSYYGGRTEIYKPYVAENYYYDINSLFGSIMRSEEMPIGNPIYYDELFFNTNFNISTFFGFLDVMVSYEPDLQSELLPILPIKSENAHAELGNIFPIGTFRGVYFSEELKYAIKHGYKILKIYSGYQLKKENIFKEYVESIYSARLDTNSTILNTFYKTLVNSLYGRYACIIRRYYSIHGRISNEMDIDASVKYQFKSVAISSAIAAYARIRVYDKLKPYMSSIIYWDTDGVFLSKPMNLISSTELGEFRLVSINKNAWFIATKFYFYDKIIQNKIFTKYVFRGIQLNKFNVSKINLIKHFNNIFSSNYKHSFNFEYPIYLKSITNPTEDPIFETHRFFNKRIFYIVFKNNKITFESIPYKITRIHD